MRDAFFAALSQSALFLPSLVLVITFRGFFRAFIARMVGDRSAQRDGFLTLNPAAHVDVYGLLIILIVLVGVNTLVPGGFSYVLALVFLMLSGVHWSFEAPIDPRNFNNMRWGIVATSLAGFIGMCVLALAMMYVATYFPYASTPVHVSMPLRSLFALIIDLALFFGVLHLIPIPPFDGGNLLSAFFSGSSLAWIESHGFILIVVLLLLGNIFFGFLSFASFFLKALLACLVI